MKLWLDAQLPPLLAQWINEQEFGVTSFAVRDLGLRDASDAEIFRRARDESAVVMTTAAADLDTDRQLQQLDAATGAGSNAARSSPAPERRRALG